MVTALGDESESSARPERRRSGISSQAVAAKRIARNCYNAARQPELKDCRRSQGIWQWNCELSGEVFTSGFPPLNDRYCYYGLRSRADRAGHARGLQPLPEAPANGSSVIDCKGR